MLKSSKFRDSDILEKVTKSLDQTYSSTVGEILLIRLDFERNDHIKNQYNLFQIVFNFIVQIKMAQLLKEITQNHIEYILNKKALLASVDSIKALNLWLKDNKY